jgi:DNA-binding protein
MTEKPQENVVLVGIKPAMNYIVACMTYFNAGAKKVILKARGRATSRAVDIVEIMRRSFIKDLEIEKISIGTEVLPSSDGRQSNVSTLEMVISKLEKAKTTG